MGERVSRCRWTHIACQLVLPPGQIRLQSRLAIVTDPGPVRL